MSRISVSHKKDSIRFTYSGDLEECIQSAEKELAEKSTSQKRVFLSWQKERAVNEFESYERRIIDLEEFIRIGKEELAKENYNQDGNNARP